MKVGQKARLTKFEDDEASKFDKEQIGKEFVIKSIDTKLYYPVELFVNEFYSINVKESEIELVEE